MTPDLILALGMLAADASQTTYIAKHPQEFREYNPILGQHPSQAKVAGYFLASGTSLVVLNAVLPAKYAHRLNWATVAVEGSFVAHNAHVGIKFTF
jgi:hypothetical protein